MNATQMIRSIADRYFLDLGDDETPVPLMAAARDVQCEEEAEHIGRAILCRAEALSDAPYRYGGDSYPADLAALAARLGWEG